MRPLLLSLLLLAACADDDVASADPSPSGGAGESADDADGEPGEGDCTPSEEQWDRVVRDMVEEHCAECHGDNPDFGAPYGLMDYAALLEGEPGARPVDRVAARVADLTMPPPSKAQPGHNDMDTIAEWASCGLLHPDHSQLVTASAEVLGAPADPPSDAEAFTLTALDYPVGEDLLDHYQCFVFEAPVDGPRLARRFDMVIDDSRVLHHLVLYRDTNKSGPDANHTCFSVGSDFAFLYAWAPGQDSFQFPEGGLRIEPGERFVVQIHYNNGAAIPGVRDNSGVRVWHSPLGGTEYGMFAPGPLNFEVAPGERKEVVGDCPITEEMTLLGGFPHMHAIGAGFKQEIIRADGTTEPFIELTGWSFESQLIYDTPATLKPGDTLRTTCIFDNPHAELVRAGTDTSDEMCFNFLYATPAPARQFCDQLDTEVEGELTYVVGECADEAALPTVERVDGRYAEGAPPELTGGEVAPGRYVLAGYTIYMPSFDVGFGVLDGDASVAQAMAQLLIEGGGYMIDITSRSVITLEAGATIPRDTKSSFAGDMVVNPDGAMEMTPTCGEDEPHTLRFEVDGDRLHVQRTIRPFGTPLTLHWEFVPAQ